MDFYLILNIARLFRKEIWGCHSKRTDRGFVERDIAMLWIPVTIMSSFGRRMKRIGPTKKSLRVSDSKFIDDAAKSLPKPGDGTVNVADENKPTDGVSKRGGSESHPPESNSTVVNSSPDNSIDENAVRETLSDGPALTIETENGFSNSKKRHCLNCDRILSSSDRYCSDCGQKVTDIRVTLWFLITDFFAQQFAFEGKLFRSLSTLMTRPGVLTIGFCGGRRARYFTPIQIYLLTGVAFFLMIDVLSNFDSISPIQVESRGFENAFDYEGTKSISFGTESADLTSEQFKEFVETSPNELRQFFEKYDIEMGSLAMFFSRGSHQMFQPGGLKAFVMTYVNVFSQSILLMMPVFGFLVYGLYWRKSEGLVQAVVFSAHVHSFNYIMLVVISIVSLALDIDWLRSMLFIVNFGYLMVASKKVFGGGYVAALIKSSIALFVYFIAVSIFVILLLPVVFITM